MTYNYDSYCEKCEQETMHQIAGPEHQSMLKRTQLWECENCGHTEER